MKQIDKEKFNKRKRSVRLCVGLTYYGYSNKMTAGVKTGDKPTEPGKMTDEELIILFQLLQAAQDGLIPELTRRDLMPDELKALFQQPLTTDGEVCVN